MALGESGTKNLLLDAAAAILALVAGVLPAAAQQGGSFEAAPQFSGTQLAPPALLKGPLHVVREPVALDGFLGRSGVESKYGTFSVAGAAMPSMRVSELTAIDLEAQNEAKLKAMKIDGRVVRDLFRNKWFTPTLQTAATVQGETRARLVVRSLRMLAEEHRKGARLTEIAMSGLVPVERPGGGDVIVAADLDYLWWNEQVAEFMQRNKLRAGRRALLISGKTSNRVTQELGKHGWTPKIGLPT